MRDNTRQANCEPCITQHHKTPLHSPALFFLTSVRTSPLPDSSQGPTKKDAHLRAATQILDYYHCKERLCLLATEVFSQPDERKQWVDKQEDRLFNDQQEEVLTEIDGLRCRGKALQMTALNSRIQFDNLKILFLNLETLFIFLSFDKSYC